MTTRRLGIEPVPLGRAKLLLSREPGDTLSGGCGSAGASPSRGSDIPCDDFSLSPTRDVTPFQMWAVGERAGVRGPYSRDILRSNAGEPGGVSPRTEKAGGRVRRHCAWPCDQNSVAPIPGLPQSLQTRPPTQLNLTETGDRP